MSEISSRLDKLRIYLSDEDFLSNKGLSNEVGLYVFAYHPNEEMQVRKFLKDMISASELPQSNEHIICFDLYDIMLKICAERRILEKIPQMEAQRGQDFILKQIQKLAPPEAYVNHMCYAEHKHGDIVFITGVGRVFPFMRSHNILNNLQHVFDDVPVVLFYPGEYTGQSLNLFEKYLDDNYYRAFNLI